MPQPLRPVALCAALWRSVAAPFDLFTVSDAPSVCASLRRHRTQKKSRPDSIETAPCVLFALFDEVVRFGDLPVDGSDTFVTGEDTLPGGLDLSSCSGLLRFSQLSFDQFGQLQGGAPLLGEVDEFVARLADPVDRLALLGFGSSASLRFAFS